MNIHTLTHAGKLVASPTWPPPSDRRAFTVEELDEVAGWIARTVTALHASAKSEPQSLWFMR